MADISEPAKQNLTANVKSAGCAAKIGPSALSEIMRALKPASMPGLLAGMEHFEDAAVLKLSDELAVIQTVDFFPPVVDDPRVFGRVAAANALSDVYAMGGRPLLALNILSFPTCDYPLAVAREILLGGQDAVEEAGAVIAGGHSIQGQEPLYGLAVTGVVHPERVLTNGGARPGDVAVLCKPVGTGVALLGLRAELLTAAATQALTASLTTLNKTPLDLALKYDVHAATDVTGFGLVGHLLEMAAASQLSFRLRASAVPLLPEVLALAEQGFVPAGAYGNRKSFSGRVSYVNEPSLALMDLFFDPQTSGGLVFALGERESVSLLSDLGSAGIQAAAIGRFSAGDKGSIEVEFDGNES